MLSYAALRGIIFPAEEQILSCAAVGRIILLYSKYLTKIYCMRKAGTIISLIIVLLLAGFIYWKYFFVFAEGTRAGILNTFQKKGYLFKTYEGQLIQSGFRGTPTTSIQSNEFSFSVTDEKIANRLMENSGKDMELHYKRYQGALPWRGMQLFVIDSIYRIAEENNTNRVNSISPQ